MIHIDDKNFEDDLSSMHDWIERWNPVSTEGKIAAAIERIKRAPLNGCITGSCLLDNFDPDAWGTKPDIDVFVFSENDLQKAMDYCQWILKMKPGKGNQRSEDQELWKIERFENEGLNKRFGITTYTFECDGIMVNTTFKEFKHRGRWVPCSTTFDVLRSFDMSIVMKGYDIKNKVMLDLRPDNIPVTTAIPNPLRRHDCMMWTVRKWVRQFDRVVKYYQRGFDTRPMAQFYLDMIDECINAGCLFDSEESQEAFKSFSEEFLEKRADIAAWLDEHKED